MHHTTAEPKALLLSKEETLALLDMCLNSAVEMRAAHEQALIKLGDMARSYLAEDRDAEAACAPIIAPIVCAPTPAPVVCAPQAAPEVLHPAYNQTPARVAFWTQSSIRSRLRSLPPMPEMEACRG